MKTLLAILGAVAAVVLWRRRPKVVTETSTATAGAGPGAPSAKPKMDWSVTTDSEADLLRQLEEMTQTADSNYSEARRLREALDAMDQSKMELESRLNQRTSELSATQQLLTRTEDELAAAKAEIERLRRTGAGLSGGYDAAYWHQRYDETRAANAELATSWNALKTLVLAQDPNVPAIQTIRRAMVQGGYAYW